MEDRHVQRVAYQIPDAMALAKHVVILIVIR